MTPLHSFVTRNWKTLQKKLESDISAVIYWFSACYMILNESKCYFLISTPNECEEQLSIKVGGQVIWESMSEVLLGVTIDKEIKFDGHVEYLCKNSSSKLTALTRMAKMAPFDKKKNLDEVLRSFAVFSLPFSMDVLHTKTK